MDTPGIEVRPIKHITGAEDFAEVFFTDVEVPGQNVVGAINDGWRITHGLACARARRLVVAVGLDGATDGR